MKLSWLISCWLMFFTAHSISTYPGKNVLLACNSCYLWACGASGARAHYFTWIKDTNSLSGMIYVCASACKNNRSLDAPRCKWGAQSHTQLQLRERCRFTLSLYNTGKDTAPGIVRPADRTRIWRICYHSFPCQMRKRPSTVAIHKYTCSQPWNAIGLHPRIQSWKHNFCAPESLSIIFAFTMSFGIQMLSRLSKGWNKYILGK